MRVIAVIGKNFGDEGKGMAVDYFSLRGGKTMVVRHNGGAQSGHTVARKTHNKKRFIFHELSSGSCCGADTLWIDSFYPDIYKLGEEISNFREMFGFCPNVYSMENVCITTLDDVLINMALESSRGSGRHGSCGMGINECDLRTKAGFGLKLCQIFSMDADALYHAMLQIRKEYTAKRLQMISGTLNAAANEYVQLLSNNNILKNSAREIVSNMKYVKLLNNADLWEKLQSIDTLIFEAGQGLLLDRNHGVYAPYVTASDTGLANPCRFLSCLDLKLDEVVYVSRTYVTRHGAGPLPNECPKEMIGDLVEDMTNKTNAWQGTLRYASHGNEDDFVTDVRKDIANNRLNGCGVSLFLTHLNETDGCVVMKDEIVHFEDFIKRPLISDTFDAVYISASEFSEDTISII
jgi:adenylosuccinate synthase